MITKQRLSYLGHMFRKPTSIKNCNMLGKMEGTSRGEKPWTRWMDSIKEAAGMKIRQIKEMPNDRDLWRKVIRGHP